MVGLLVGREGGVCEKVPYTYIHNYLPTYLPNNIDSSDTTVVTVVPAATVVTVEKLVTVVT